MTVNPPALFVMASPLLKNSKHTSNNFKGINAWLLPSLFWPPQRISLNHLPILVCRKKLFPLQ